MIVYIRELRKERGGEKRIKERDGLAYHELKVFACNQLVSCVLCSNQKVSYSPNTATKSVAIVSTNQELHLDDKICVRNMYTFL